MAYDADEVLEAHGRWTFRAGGITYPARPVSGEAAAAFFEDAVESAEPVRQRQAVRRLLRLMFPPQLSDYWRGNPRRAFRALPAPMQREALADFFRWLHRLGGEPVTPRPATPLMTSPTNNSPSPATPEPEPGKEHFGASPNSWNSSTEPRGTSRPSAGPLSTGSPLSPRAGGGGTR